MPRYLENETSYSLQIKKSINYTSKATLWQKNSFVLELTFNDINDQLKDIKENFTKSVYDIVTESISKVKDPIIEALREENIKLQTKCKNLGATLFELQKASNKQDQYSRRNNLEIHGIPAEVKDDQLEEKVIDIFSQLNISLSKSDIEDCHRLGKSNTTVLDL